MPMNHHDLAQLLIDKGHASATGVTRTARFRLCAKCDAVIVRGLDDPKVAGEAHTDPTPLNALGEAVALISGRSTYSLAAAAAGRLVLDHRNRWRIAAAPAETGAFDVVADHACGQSSPATLTAPSRIPNRRQREDTTDEPPY